MEPRVAAGTRHLLGLSGGKDSAALAIFMRGKVPEMEYFFCDTGKELPETYEFLQRLEVALGKPIIRLNADRDFDHWLFVYQGALPSPQMRWCTRMLKLKPFEAWVGDDPAVTYIGIRADENRDGYISHKPNITARFPFKEEGLVKNDIIRILENAGVGVPEYYTWRSRSGCYFCFFQRKIEWVMLSEKHPDLFERAVEYEDKLHYEATAMQERTYTWTQGESLRELIARKDQIKEQHEAKMAKAALNRPNLPLLDVLGEVLDAEDDGKPCAMCHI
jgi:hypothetical protein